jgi:hypothetical protein
MSQRKPLTPMQRAVLRLHETASGIGLAAPEQIMAACVEFDLEPHALEGVYLDDCDRIAAE